MTTAEDIVRSVYEYPNEDLPWLVAADFFDDIGEHERATEIRRVMHNHPWRSGDARGWVWWQGTPLGCERGPADLDKKTFDKIHKLHYYVRKEQHARHPRWLQYHSCEQARVLLFHAVSGLPFLSDLTPGVISAI